MPLLTFPLSEPGWNSIWPARQAALPTAAAKPAEKKEVVCAQLRLLGSGELWL